MPFDIPAFAYAAAVAGGGVLGYVKSSEFNSLSHPNSSSAIQVFIDTYFDV